MELKGSTIRGTLFDGLMLAYAVAFGVIAVRGTTLDRLTETFEQSIIGFALVLVMGAILTFLLNQRGVKTLGELIFTPPHRRLQSSMAPKPIYKTFWGGELFVVLSITLVIGCVLTDIDFLRLLDADAISQAGRVFRQLFTPDWVVLPKAVMKVLQTVYMAFMATAFAVPIAFTLSFLTAKNIMGGTAIGSLIYTVLRFCFNVSRSIEPVIWAIVFSIWVSFGPFAGMLALLVHSVASLAKQYSEIVEGVDDGPIEAITATGAGRVQTVWFAIVPQIILPYLSYTIYRWDTNVRSATILGIVGGGGIGTMLMEYLGQSMWHQVGTIVVVISLVVWMMDAFSAHVRAALK